MKADIINAVRSGFFLFAFASGLFAQSFGVATIKPTAPDWKGGRYIRMQSAHLLEVRNQPVKTLIASAYNLSPLAISGYRMRRSSAGSD